MSNMQRCLLYYVIAFGLAVAVAALAPVLGASSPLVTMFTPTVAVVVLLGVADREGGWRGAGRALGLTTLGLKGWPFAIIGPTAILFAGLWILVLAGLTTVAAPDLSGTWLKIMVNVLAGLAVSSFFSLFEEIGWRGYLLPRMTGFGLVGGMLVVGFLHGLWHLPLLLTTNYYHSTGNPWIVAPMFVLTLTLAGVFYGYLRISTGSVWPVAVAHGATNMAWNISSEISETRSPLVLEYVGGESGVIMIAGLLATDLVLIWIMRRDASRRGRFGDWTVTPSSS
jgi:uncharacterized protein